LGKVYAVGVGPGSSKLMKRDTEKEYKLLDEVDDVW